jgi:hypothetical protein
MIWCKKHFLTNWFRRSQLSAQEFRRIENGEPKLAVFARVQYSIPKVIVALGSIELAGKHATLLEIYVLSRMGRDRCGLAFQVILCGR